MKTKKDIYKEVYDLISSNQTGNLFEFQYYDQVSSQVYYQVMQVVIKHISSRVDNKITWQVGNLIKEQMYEKFYY